MIKFIKSSGLLSAAIKRPPVLYGRAWREIHRVENLNAAMRAEFQAQTVKNVLAAARKLPGYANAPAADEIHQWPILEKSSLKGREKDFSARSFGPETSASTGGTTGQPLNLTRNLQGVAFEQAMIDWLCMMSGVDARCANVAILRGDSIKDANDMSPPFWIDQGSKKRVYSAHHLNAGTIAQYMSALNAQKPDILFCYPSSLQMLTALGEELPSADTPHIPLIFSSSEVLGKSTADRARQVFSARVIDYFGHAERTVCAWSNDSVNYWFNAAYGYVELLPAGDGLAEIIATSLRLDGQVFVRYRTDDLARVPSHDPGALREIALGIKPFQGVEGRTSEYIELENGRRIIGLNHIPRGVPGVSSVQLHQAGKSIHVYMVPGKDYSAASVKAVRENLAAKFPSSVHFRVFTSPAALREKNGKAPLLLRQPVVSNLTEIEFEQFMSMEHA